MVSGPVVGLLTRLQAELRVSEPVAEDYITAWEARPVSVAWRVASPSRRANWSGREAGGDRADVDREDEKAEDDQSHQDLGPSVR